MSTSETATSEEANNLAAHRSRAIGIQLTLSPYHSGWLVHPISLSTCAAKKTVPVFRCCTFFCLGNWKWKAIWLPGISRISGVGPKRICGDFSKLANPEDEGSELKGARQV